MKKLNNTVNKLTVSAYVKSGRIKQKLTDIFTRKDGEGFVDTALFS